MKKKIYLEHGPGPRTLSGQIRVKGVRVPNIEIYNIKDEDLSFLRKKESLTPIDSLKACVLILVLAERWVTIAAELMS